MKVYEFTMRRRVSGPVLATVKIEVDPRQIAAIRGNSEKADQLESDLAAAVLAVTGGRAEIIHQREYELHLT